MDALKVHSAANKGKGTWIFFGAMQAPGFVVPCFVAGSITEQFRYLVFCIWQFRLLQLFWTVFVGLTQLAQWLFTFVYLYWNTCHASFSKSEKKNL